MDQSEKIIAERAGKISSGISAQAKVVSYKETSSPSIGSNGKAPVLRFTLEIIMPNAAPYQAETWWLVYPIAALQLQVGNMVAVRLNVKDKMVVYPDNIPSVEYDWRVEMGWKA